VRRDLTHIGYKRNFRCSELQELFVLIIKKGCMNNFIHAIY